MDGPTFCSEGFGAEFLLESLLSGRRIELHPRDSEAEPLASLHPQLIH
jgi:hypothetical protein